MHLRAASERRSSAVLCCLPTLPPFPLRPNTNTLSSTDFSLRLVTFLLLPVSDKPAASILIFTQMCTHTHLTANQ